MNCPKCGFEQAGGVECVRCGVIFSRVRAAAGAPVPAPFVPPISAATAPMPPAAAIHPAGGASRALAAPTATFYDGPVPAAPGAPAAPTDEPPERGAGGATMFDPDRVIVDKRAVQQTGPVFGSELLREAVGIFGANLFPFCLLAGLALTPSYIVGFIASAQNEGGSDAGLAMFVTALFCQPLATGAVTFGVFNHMRKRDVSVGECLGVGIASLGRVVMVGIIQTLWLALLLFASGIPSILLLFLGGAMQSPKTGVTLSILFGIALVGYRFFATLVKLSVSVPSAIEEKLGPVAALKRSMELTDGNRWPIFRALFFIGCLNLALQGGTVLLLDQVLHVPEAKGLTGTLVSVVTTALGAVASAVIYYRLRGFEESVDVNEIASVFG